MDDFIVRKLHDGIVMKYSEEVLLDGYTAQSAVEMGHDLQRMNGDVPVVIIFKNGVIVLNNEETEVDQQALNAFLS